MSHHCHAVGCARSCPAKMLFCLKHWRMTPQPTQKLIWSTYRKGQEITKTPSAAYLIAQAVAVADVATREGKWTAMQCVNHLTVRMRLVIEKLTPQDILTLRKHPMLADVFTILDGAKEIATEPDSEEAVFNSMRGLNVLDPDD